MTILEKADPEPRTVGLFQKHETTTPLASVVTGTDKQTKEKENERLNHFSSIMEVPKRPAQTQEIGPMKKKAGGRELHSDFFFLMPLLPLHNTWLEGMGCFLL